MKNLFVSCLGEAENEQLQTSTSSIQMKLPEPFKLKFFKVLNLYEPILRRFALPHRLEPYTFPRKNLRILQNQKCSVPFLYNGVSSPQSSILLIYSHGSGSTLNHVYQFIMGLSWKFNISTIAYDYTGDGESSKQFHTFEDDLKIILSWALNLGYSLNNIILCGFSLGSYSALCLKGSMSRILISPICGLTAYIEDNAARYEGQIYDNVEKSLSIKARVLITHCTKQMIPIQHAKLIEEALLTNNQRQNVQFIQIKEGYQHKTAPGFLFSQEGTQILNSFIQKVSYNRKNRLQSQEDKELKEQLQNIYSSIILKQSQKKIST